MSGTDQILIGAEEKIESVISMLEAIANNIKFASGNSIVVFNAFRVATSELEELNNELLPKIENVNLRNENSATLVQSTQTKLEKLLSNIAQLSDNIDQVRPKVSDIQKLCESAAPELKTLHKSLSPVEAQDNE